MVPTTRSDNYWDSHSSSQIGLLPTEHPDKRLNWKDLVIGVGIGDPHKEYGTEADLRKLKQKGNWKLIQDTIGEKTLQFKKHTVGFSAVDDSGRRWDMSTGTGSEDKSLKPMPQLNIE